MRMRESPASCFMVTFTIVIDSLHGIGKHVMLGHQ